MQTKAATAIALSIAAATLAACGFASDDKSSSDDGDSVKVGFIGPLTGEYAVYGESSFQAAQLAVSQWNAKGGVAGKKIELVRGDSQGDPKQSATLARRFVDQGVQAVIGPTFTLESETAVPILCAAEIFAVTGLADPLQEGEAGCYFQTSPRVDHAAEYGAKVVTEQLGAKSVAIIDDGTADQRNTAGLIKDDVEGSADVVFSGSVSPGRQDYATTLTKVKSLNPDVIFLATYNPETATLRKQGAELGVEADWVATVGNVNDQFKDRAGASGTPTFSYEPGKSEEGFGAFSDAYQKRFGDAPGELNEYTFDAANALFTGIDAAGTLDYQKVVDQMHAMKDFTGSTGPITFDEIGRRGREVFQTLEYGDDQEWAPVEAATSGG